MQFNNITEFPCILLNNETHCGLYDKKELKEILCNIQNLSIC